ncbi:dipeptide ABC transporter ATP-binding protein [Bounagaea algeriensis]
MSESPLLQCTDLRVRFRADDGDADAVNGIGFHLDRGEVLAVVGESGSGKSVTALSALGLLPQNAEVRGSLALGGTELVGQDEAELRRLRGRRIAMVFQEPMTSLNPVFTIGWQLVETVRLHDEDGAGRARERAAELLGLVGIPEPRRRLRYYPHQLSGGQRQRVVLALALACRPQVLVADEPTTALDVTAQADILALLRDLRERFGMSVLLITHDMGVVADLADRVLVMRHGEVVEQAPVRELFREPRHDYTARLLAAVPSLRVEDTGADGRPSRDQPVLQISDLSVDYGSRRVVDRVSLRIDRAEVLGLVGESGSGKSTIGRCAARLIRPSAGAVELLGQDVTRLPQRALRRWRGHIGVVFQDPGSSLDPRRTVGDSIAEPLRVHRRGERGARARRVAELLDAVELGEGTERRYPHELSGGQRQRVSIARALALEPELLIADEPTSALDVSVQDAVLGLLQRLQQEHGFGCLFISHDLAVINRLADRVAVLRAGELVECAGRKQVLAQPTHPHTRQLLAAAPVADPDAQQARQVVLG